MTDRVVLVAAALLAGAPLSVAPGPVAAACMVIAWLLRRRVAPGMLAFALGCAAVSGLRARAATGEAKEAHERALDLLTPPSRCVAEGVVEGSPVVLGRATGPAIPGDGQARVDVELTSGRCGEQAIVKPLRARLFAAPEDLRRGDRVFVVADLAPIHVFLEADGPDPWPRLASAGVSASGGAQEVRVVERSWSVRGWIDGARAAVRARIEATYHPDASALGRALVLGEADLVAEDDEAFRVSGLSHLLAVSGTHLVLAVAGFCAALRALLLRVTPVSSRVDVGRWAAAVAVPASWLYADFAGGSGSALRAAAMLSAGMLARALNRRAPASRTLGCSLAGMALVDPLVACDLSFALSAGATVGLMVFQKPIAAAIVRGPAAAQMILGPIATTLAATAGCTPLLAILSPTLPLLGIASNLIAAPLGELAALPICLGHAVLGWAPPLEKGAALLGSGALLGVRAVARWSTAAGAVVAVPPPTPWQLAGFAVAAVGVWVSPPGSARRLAVGLGALFWAALEVAAARAGSPTGKLRVTALDVGQGDSILVDLPDGSAMLFDGGGMVGSPLDLGERVVQPVLRARRRKRLRAMVLSHPHPDHFGGLVSTLGKVEVGELWDTGQGEDLGAGPAYAALLASARAQGVAIRRPKDLCGAPQVVGGASLEVLAPCPGYAPDVGANDNSFVIRISFGERAVMLVGDAEHAAEEGLVRTRRGSLHADLLKVGHHGSRTSTSPEFLRAVEPSLAVISCGVRNRFGHPHPKALATLAAAGVPALRTDRGGAVVWETDGHSIEVSRP